MDFIKSLEIGETYIREFVVKPEDTAKRALGYANDSISSSAKSTKETQEALDEAQIEAREETKAEQETALKEHMEKATQKAEAEKAQSQQQTTNKPTASDTVVNSKEVKVEIVDTVEISQAGKAALDSKASTETVADTKASSVPVDVANHCDNAAATETKIYTLKGGVKHTAAKPKLSVKV